MFVIERDGLVYFYTNKSHFLTALSRGGISKMYMASYVLELAYDEGISYQKTVELKRYKVIKDRSGIFSRDTRITVPLFFEMLSVIEKGFSQGEL